MTERVLAVAGTPPPAGEPVPGFVAAPPPAAPIPPGGALDDVQRRHIEATLARAGWVIEGANGAARQLGLHPNTLRSRMKRLGIRRPGIAGDDAQRGRPVP